MTSETAREKEERIATELNRKLQASIISARTRSAIAAAALYLLAAVLAVPGYWMMFFISFCMASIFAILCSDAHGHLQEVRRRSTKRLFVDMSVLRRPDDESPGDRQRTSTADA